MTKVLGDDPFAGGEPDKRAAAKASPKKAPKKPAKPQKSKAKAPAREAAQEAAKKAPARKDPAPEPPEPSPPEPAPAPEPVAVQPPPETSIEVIAEVTALAPVPRLPAPEPPARRRQPALSFALRRYRDFAMRSRSPVVDEFGLDPQVARRADPVLEFLYRNYFRVETSGLGNIPDRGRALIVANHSGTLPYDGAMLMYAVRREHPLRRTVRPLVEDFVFHFPYLGTLINRIGGVRACQENAERLLQHEQLLAVFPEGIKGISKLYSERYQLQRFGRGGFVKLALRTGAPIVPAAIVGAEEIQPMLGKVTWLARPLGIPYVPITPTFPWLGPLGLLPLPSKWCIRFGEPMYLHADHGPQGAEDRLLVNKLAEQVRQKIQEMVNDLLRSRKSVIFG